MRTKSRSLEDDDDDYLHPLWLGILMLLTVVSVIGLSCLVRKRYGAELYLFYRRLCCRNQASQGKRHCRSEIPV